MKKLELYYNEESCEILLNGVKIASWNDEAVQDYPEDLTWRRDIGVLVRECVDNAYKLGTEDSLKNIGPITKLAELLKKDEAYYYSWQANIAMAFKDQLSRNNVSFEKSHEIANDAAKNFLNLLIKEGVKDE